MSPEILVMLVMITSFGWFVRDIEARALETRIRWLEEKLKEGQRL